MIFIINYLKVILYTKIDAWSACSIAMNDHACILIWDAHTRMGHNIVRYAYGISPTHMGRPIRVWANIHIWGRTLLLCG